MQRLRPLLLLVPLVLVLGSAASAGSTKTNGLVSFGACCGNQVGIYVIKPNGTGERRLLRPEFDDASLSTAWSPDGKRIAFVAPGGLWTMSASGTGRTRLTKGKGETSGPTWSADARRIAFGDLAKPGVRKHDIYVINVNGSGIRHLVSGDAFDPAWAPNGKTIMFERGGSLWSVRPDGRGQKRIRAGSAPAWAPDSKRVAFDSKGQIWTMNSDGTGARLVVDIPSAESGFAWSPDGRWIAYTIGNRGDVRLVHPDGTGDKRLTRAPGLFHSQPAWQPK
ncbi:MAG TPA: hypothetical protein VF895_01785 [Gaiellaceae bacterium]